MDTTIIADTPAFHNVPETPARQEREKECMGCGQFVRFAGPFCPACRAKLQTAADAFPLTAPPRKVTLPKPSRRETYAAGCCRLTHQGLLNHVWARPVLGVAFAHELTWHVSSQAGAGGYTVTWHTAAGTWSCGCDAHTGGKLCAHVALCRTWLTECPVCAGVLVVYADRAGVDRPGDYQGAVRCTGSCGLLTDLTGDEAEALQEAHLGLHPLSVLGLLLVIVRRVDRQAQEASAA